ncbi:MAG: hypothetical protein RLZZ427_248 [Pseudomonadota bacterium]|jgi:uncharacterized protein with NRDE domain
MCVAAIAWDAHPRWQLLAIGNRDEFHARPTAPLARWDNGIIAGRDLEAGGTWLGVARGRFALVTNYRVDGYPKPQLASRGGLITNWLTDRPLGDVMGMNPFNLLTIAPEQAAHLANHPAAARTPLAPGIHGMSNGGFDDRWGKTLRLETALEQWLQTDTSPDCLFDALADRRLDDPTPATGPAREFSSVFITNPTYGTRCSTVIAIDRAGRGTISERSFAPDGAPSGQVTLDFNWNA